MTIEEELVSLREEYRVLREQLAQRDELIQQQQALLWEQSSLLQQHSEQISSLREQLKAMQERLAKDSHNSHVPPSADRFVRRPKSLRKKGQKPSGGQPGHRGSSLSWSSTPDEIIERSRSSVPTVSTSPGPPFPPECRLPCNMERALGAMAVYLVEQQLLPLARACEVMRDLLFVQMSEGTVCELIARCAGRLVPVEQQIKAALTKAEVIHQDESGLSVGGKRHWMHVTCTPTLTHYQVDASRGQGALEAIGILPQFSGISIHDGWASYFLYDCQHAICFVHVLRELVLLAEEQGAVWAAAMIELLLERKQATDEVREQGKPGLDPLEVVDGKACFLELLDEADRLHPHALAPPGTRRRGIQSPARNLLDRLRKHQQAVLLFLEDLRVDFDNNLAERDLRMVNV